MLDFVSAWNTQVSGRGGCHEVEDPTLLCDRIALTRIEAVGCPGNVAEATSTYKGTGGLDLAQK